MDRLWHWLKHLGEVRCFECGSVDGPFIRDPDPAMWDVPSAFLCPSCLREALEKFK